MPFDDIMASFTGGQTTPAASTPVATTLRTPADGRGSSPQTGPQPERRVTLG